MRGDSARPLRVALDVLATVAVVVAIVYMVVWWPRALPRGRSARAADGGGQRYTRWGALNLVVLIAALALLIATRALK